MSVLAYRRATATTGSTGGVLRTDAKGSLHGNIGTSLHRQCTISIGGNINLIARRIKKSVIIVCHLAPSLRGGFDGNTVVTSRRNIIVGQASICRIIGDQQRVAGRNGIVATGQCATGQQINLGAAQAGCIAVRLIQACKLSRIHAKQQRTFRHKSCRNCPGSRRIVSI